MRKKIRKKYEEKEEEKEEEKVEEKEEEAEEKEEVEELLEKKEKDASLASVEILEAGRFRKLPKKRTKHVEDRPSKRARILPEVLKDSEILISFDRGDTKGTLKKSKKC